MPLLFATADQLLEARDPAAVEVWTFTGESAPVGIFNGDFARGPLNHGFDWRVLGSRGVTHVNLDAPPGHRIAFSGQQTESCLLMEQTLNLTEGKRYRLQWEARTVGIKNPSGLAWRMAGQQAAIAPSVDWAAGGAMSVFHLRAQLELKQLLVRR